MFAQTCMRFIFSNLYTNKGIMKMQNEIKTNFIKIAAKRTNHMQTESPFYALVHMSVILMPYFSASEIYLVHLLINLKQ